MSNKSKSQFDRSPNTRTLGKHLFDAASRGFFRKNSEKARFKNTAHSRLFRDSAEFREETH
jgi:hypothetical protein